MKINSIEALRELYDLPKGRAKDKVLTVLEKHAIHFIKNAPFLVMSTYSKLGQVDASPRGGHSGFVSIVNESKLIIPDAIGNNRLDSITNIIETGRIGLLFLIPGINETLRLNGSAYLSTHADYLQLFSSEMHTPKACIVVTVEEVFLHCAKAFMRSKLWDPSLFVDRNTFPSMGKMLKDQLGMAGDPETRAAMEKRYLLDL
ncbi:MSMEG_1061 family FMN-dependent PPOX-type flavoprotein [Algibacter mikhailovii]|uniref:Phosphohydrolase n=1 Tax=Algibacter mikhailovii TaxID=425498 RepID=A0A918QSR2_9FLAO|nr:MSMEG_1061 family FMN-dependent PPOX-type flavoprotein [Algibacter mikhailovii]GGZ71284.1 phosphohydrolase [Algibacter mikhailovii]